ncbi:hypothetical protein SCG7109_AB_00610 [Chlamydiales bacterium SCGC AG-110-M15]|nr:hypothetical protein SCG7109_AB_00610 [Chlamydiales bacterium SCGC AG-110-M15]
MLLGFHANVSGMNYNSEILDVVSNNLSNTDTSGFRRSLSVIRSREEHDNSKWVDSDARERLPGFHGVQRTGIYKIYKDTGKLQETGNSMDVAIPPELQNAFFAVKRNDGDPNTYYTRNGTLSFGLQDISNPNSPNVLYLGGHLALDDGNQAIEIDPSFGELSIGADGQVMQGETAIAELPIYRMNKSPDPNVQQSANLQLLNQMGDSLFRIPPESRQEFNPFRIEIGNGINRVLVQGMRESSNVNPMSELVHMMEATKSYSSNASAIERQMGGLEKLFELVRR